MIKLRQKIVLHIPHDDFPILLHVRPDHEAIRATIFTESIPAGDYMRCVVQEPLNLELRTRVQSLYVWFGAIKQRANLKDDFKDVLHAANLASISETSVNMSKAVKDPCEETHGRYSRHHLHVERIISTSSKCLVIAGLM